MAQKVVLLQLILYGEHNMNKEKKIKVYTYTRVSTAMQVDGYSLDAQKAKMKAYADYNDYEIAGEYEDAESPASLSRAGRNSAR